MVGRSLYGYDDVYRLTSETISALPGGSFNCGANGQKCGTVGYTYDDVGNRQRMTSTLAAIPPGMFFYSANDQLTTDIYDSNGNTVSFAGISNVYDFENRMVQKGAVTIVYDGDGNRLPFRRPARPFYDAFGNLDLHLPVRLPASCSLTVVVFVAARTRRSNRLQ